MVLRETLADLCIDRMFRTDIFRRGMASVRHLEYRKFVDAVTVIWSGADYEAAREVAVTGGSVHLDESFYRPLVERLAQDALTGADVREVVRGRGLPESEVGGTLALLVAGGYAVPALPVAGRAVEPTMRMNRALLERTRLGNHLGFLVAPNTGTTIPIDIVGMLAAGACWEGVPPDAASLTERVGQQVRDLGLVSSVTGREAIDDAFDHIVAASVAHARHLMTRVFPPLGIEGVQPATVVPARVDPDGEGEPPPPRIRSDVAWVAAEGAIVALNGAGRAHVLDGTGALLWPLLDGSAGTDDLVQDVADVFDIDAERARADVETFLTDVVGRELVVRTETPEPVDAPPGSAHRPEHGPTTAGPHGAARSGVGRRRGTRRRGASGQVERRSRRPRRVAVQAVRRLALRRWRTPSRWTSV